MVTNPQSTAFTAAHRSTRAHPADARSTVRTDLLVPAAVLFDMDGTLTDSEKLWYQAEWEAFTDLGMPWSYDDQKLVIGLDIIDGSRRALDYYGVQADAEQVGRSIIARVIELATEHGVPWRPGALELLTWLSQMHIPSALVTSSYLPFASMVASKAPKGSLEALVTGDRVTHSKPHPEPFRMAASMLGKDPHECVAFEDSVYGVQSAHDSGAITVAVPFQVEIPAQPGVIVLDSLEHADAAFFDRVVRERRELS
ncbi:MAG: HAD family phosphatase [Actinomycetaceae bacterium]|nr:HAD family phosphatase [Actinomycetaceae bacterium]